MLDEPADRTLFSAASHLAAFLRARYQAAMMSRGFSWHQSAGADLLAHIPAAGISQSVLTAATGLSKQAVQQSLDALEAQGVIRREVDAADRRARRIALTDLGLRDAAARREVLATLEAESRVLLGRKAHKKLRKSLRQLVAD